MTADDTPANPITPDHDSRTTWPVCVHPECATPVDPWDHNTRCAAHRPPALTDGGDDG